MIGLINVQFSKSYPSCEATLPVPETRVYGGVWGLGARANRGSGRDLWLRHRLGVHPSDRAAFHVGHLAPSGPGLSAATLWRKIPPFA